MTRPLQAVCLLATVGSAQGALAQGCIPSNVFREASFTPTGERPWDSVVADFDGDGSPDMAVSNSSGDSVTMLFGNGDGTFTPYDLPSFFDGPDGIDAIDLNNDGLLDVVTYARDVFGAINNGDRTFGQASLITNTLGGVYLIAEDFNVDGTTDFVGRLGFSSLGVVMSMPGGGYTEPEIVPIGNRTGRLVSADFNGDGLMDIASPSYFLSEELRVHLNDGSGSFLEPQVLPLVNGGYAIDALDMDGDGDIDLVTGYSPASVFVNDGAGVFSLAVQVPIASGRGLAAGDLNNDGFMDIVAGDSGGVRISLSIDHLVFGDVVEFDLSEFQVVGNPTAQNLHLADLDNDNDLDLIVTDLFDDGVYVSLNTCARLQTCIADVNEDGTLDGADFNAWLAAYNSADPTADQNKDGILNGADFNAFLFNFRQLCE